MIFIFVTSLFICEYSLVRLSLLLFVQNIRYTIYVQDFQNEWFMGLSFENTKNQKNKETKKQGKKQKRKDKTKQRN